MAKHKDGEMTPWFGPNQKPVRVGVYLTCVDKFDRHPWDGYAYWMGDRWASSQITINGAGYYRYTVSSCQARYWRGLTKPSEAK